MRTYNPTVTVQVYIGSGKKALKVRDNMEKARGSISISKFIMDIIRKANPSLFKGADDGQK